jgi:hypothetical protein
MLQVAEMIELAPIAQPEEQRPSKPMLAQTIPLA